MIISGSGGASAHAALPEFSGSLPDGGSVHSVLSKFENKGALLAVACRESEGLLTVDTVKEEAFDELFLGCEATLGGIKLGKCTGLMDFTTGSILEKGTLTLGFELGTLVPIAALTVSPMHFECPLGTLVDMSGCLVGTITLAKSRSGALTFEGLAGTQKFVDYTNDAGTMIACSLQSSVNGGAASASDQIQAASVAFSNELEVKD